MMPTEKTTLASKGQARYLADFRALEKEIATKPAWLQQLRRHAISRFSELGFPTARRGNEPWKYTNVTPIAEAQFGQPEATARPVKTAELRGAVPWHDDWDRLVFVNNHYSETLSKPPAAAQGINVGSLADILCNDGNLVQSHLGHEANLENNGFTALNTAFLEDGALVYLDKGRSLPVPLHLIFVTTDERHCPISHPRTMIIAGPSSNATIIESYVGLESGRYFTNAITEGVLSEGAQIKHYRLLLESENAFHVGSTHIRQGRDSAFSSTVFEEGAALGRYNLNTILDGPGSSCLLYGLYITSGNQHIDNNINIDHAKPHTTSRLYYKGILDGKSKAIFGGMVLVRRDAQKVDAHQSDKNLILSDEAEIYSKPSLEIYADDVKAGHGATAGAITDEALFYMMSRGLNEKTASTLLIKGFTSEIIDTVELEPLRNYLESRVMSGLPALSNES